VDPNSNERSDFASNPHFDHKKVTISILSGQHLPKPAKGNQSVFASIKILVFGLPIDEAVFSTPFVEGNFSPQWNDSHTFMMSGVSVGILRLELVYRNVGRVAHFTTSFSTLKPGYHYVWLTSDSDTEILNLASLFIYLEFSDQKRELTPSPSMDPSESQLKLSSSSNVRLSVSNPDLRSSVSSDEFVNSGNEEQDKNHLGGLRKLFVKTKQGNHQETLITSQNASAASSPNPISTPNVNQTSTSTPNLISADSVEDAKSPLLASSAPTITLTLASENGSVKNRNDESDKNSVNSRKGSFSEEERKSVKAIEIADRK